MNSLTKISIVILILAILVGGGFWATQNWDLLASDGENPTVERGEVFQRVTVAGRAKSASVAGLSLEVGGKIEKLMVKSGDSIEVGQEIAVIESKKQKEALAKARATHEIALRELEELRNGVRKEDLAVSNAELAKALSASRGALEGLVNNTRSAYVTADDALSNKTNQFFRDPDTSRAEIYFLFDDYDLKKKIEASRSDIRFKIQKWKISIDSLSNEKYSDTTYTQSIDILNETRNYLDLLSSAVNNFEVNDSYPLDVVNKYKTDLGSARENVIASIASLTSTRAEYDDKLSLADVIERQIELKKSGTREEVISAQEERVKLALSDIRDAEIELGRTILKSPIGGVVSGLEKKPGEIVSSGEIIAKVISNEMFELEADVPEIHVGKVDLGQKAEIIFDAFPGDTYVGVVERIDVGPTMIDGVVNYKTVIKFEAGKNFLRNGMSGTVRIQVEEKKDVLVVPSYLIERGPEGEYIYVSTADGKEKVKVEIGVVGDNGLTEVVSGLNIGDVIIPADKR